MTQEPANIEPERVYDEYTLRQRGHPFTSRALKEGRDSGRLRFREAAVGRVYRGRWLLDWLQLERSPAKGRS